jgi:hypothetical protein
MPELNNNAKIAEIKTLTDAWRDGKCFHCGTQMEVSYMGDKPTEFRCPKCDWVDRFTNQWNYLIKIGRICGTIFYMTGAADPLKLREYTSSS